MNGHLLFNMICVDYWKRYTDKYIHFLTHCHADHTVGLTSTWRFPIYTSLFNAWMLKTKFKINPHRLKPLIIGRSYIIKLPRNGEMSVTLIDANHCPGSVMFLFQGFFGTMLYTGDFRYDPVMLENQALTQVLRNKLLDDLFVDNTYAAEKCKIPSRSKATQEIFEIIRKHPDHVVLLGLRNLGKEELLRAIALEFNEQIYVSEERLQVLQQLMYEDVFTTDCKSCRIHVVDIRSVTVSYMKQRQEEHPHIAILPTALYKYGPDVANHPYKNSAEHGIFVVPYSDHSPYEELFTFISQLKPAKIHPIIEAKQISNNDNRSLSYWQEVSQFSVIPNSLYDLCCKQESNNFKSDSEEKTIFCSANKPETVPPKLILKSSLSKEPKIVRKKRVTDANEKKGVQFESSDASSDEISSELDANCSKEISVRKEIAVKLREGKVIKVNVPSFVKDSYLEVEVVLFDISKLWNSVANIFSHISICDTKTLHKHLPHVERIDCDLLKEFASVIRDKTVLCKSTGNTMNDEVTALPWKHGNLPLQNMPLSYALHIKDVSALKKEPVDVNNISFSSASTVVIGNNDDVNENTNYIHSEDVLLKDTDGHYRSESGSLERRKVELTKQQHSDELKSQAVSAKKSYGLHKRKRMNSDISEESCNKKMRTETHKEGSYTLLKSRTEGGLSTMSNELSFRSCMAIEDIQSQVTPSVQTVDCAVQTCGRSYDKSIATECVIKTNNSAQYNGHDISKPDCHRSNIYKEAVNQSQLSNTQLKSTRKNMKNLNYWTYSSRTPFIAADTLLAAKNIPYVFQEVENLDIGKLLYSHKMQLSSRKSVVKNISHNNSMDIFLKVANKFR
ncbi:uncharacterized protein [Periplaneta americana]